MRVPVYYPITLTQAKVYKLQELTALLPNGAGLPVTNHHRRIPFLSARTASAHIAKTIWELVFAHLSRNHFPTLLVLDSFSAQLILLAAVLTRCRIAQSCATPSTTGCTSFAGLGQAGVTRTTVTSGFQPQSSWRSSSLRRLSCPSQDVILLKRIGEDQQILRR